VACWQSVPKPEQLRYSISAIQVPPTGYERRPPATDGTHRPDDIEIRSLGRTNRLAVSMLAVHGATTFLVALLFLRFLFSILMCGRGLKHDRFLRLQFARGRSARGSLPLETAPRTKRTTTLPTKRVGLSLGGALALHRQRKTFWTLGAILCEETSPTGEKTTFAWLANLAVNRDSVIAIADQSDGYAKNRNEGFNVQKNTGLKPGARL